MTLVYSPAIRLFPVFIAETSEKAGWLTPFFAVLPYIGLVYLIQEFFKKHNDKNLSDIFFSVLGNIGGRFVLCFYWLWMMVLLGLYVRYFAERFLMALIPNSSMNFFTVTILAVVFYAVRGGFVALTRTTEYLFLTFTVIFIILFVLSIGNIEIINLFPVTHYDILPLIKSCYVLLGIWAYFTFIFFLADKMNDKEHIKRFGMQGGLYLVIMAFVILVQTIGEYGHTVVKRVPLPYFSVIKGISVLKTIERIESVVLACWVFVDFVIISVFIYIITSIIKSFFSLSETKSFVSPITMFAFVFSNYIARNRFELENFSNICLALNIFLGFIVPFFIFVIGKLRKRI